MGPGLGSDVNRRVSALLVYRHRAHDDTAFRCPSHSPGAGDRLIAVVSEPPGELTWTGWFIALILVVGILLAFALSNSLSRIYRQRATDLRADAMRDPIRGGEVRWRSCRICGRLKDHKTKSTFDLISASVSSGAVALLCVWGAGASAIGLIWPRRAR